MLQAAESRFRQCRAYLRARICHQLLLHRLQHEHRDALHRFEDEVARKAVRDADIRNVAEQIARFHAADEVIRRFRHHRERILHQRIALFVLRANVDNADAGLLDAHHAAHVRVAHHAELRQVFRLAVHICAAVNEQEIALAVGHQRGKRRTLHARNAPQPEHAARQHRARRPGRDEPVRFLVADSQHSQHRR